MVDCDVHNEVPSWRDLLPHLDGYWRESIEQGDFKGPPASWWLPSGPAPVSLDDVRRDVLSRADGAVLTCTYGAASIYNPYAAAAMAAAVNDWQIATWLDPEPRLRASIVVPAGQPVPAANEIDRVGGHPGFVQVMLPVRSAMPYGNPSFWPVFEAAERNGLAICLHAGGMPGNAPTGTGWPSTYAEQVAGMAGAFQSQLISLLAEGVFARFEALHVVLAEAGFAWLPPFLWRVEKEWKGLRRETPWTRGPRAEIVGERVSFTLQPIDCPPDRLSAVLDRMPPDVLIDASDYPHVHADRPAGIDAARLDAKAREVYRWQ